MTEVGLLGSLGNTLEQCPVSTLVWPSELYQAGEQACVSAGCCLNVLIVNLRSTLWFGITVPVFQLKLQLEGL